MAGEMLVGQPDDMSRPRREVAFVTAMRKYEPALKAYVIRRVKSDSLTDDVVQEVYLKVWKSFTSPSPRTGKSFDPTHWGVKRFLIKTASRIIKNRHSLDSRLINILDQSLSSDGESKETHSSTIIDPNGEDPSATLIRIEEACDLQRALESLTPRENEAITRYYINKEGNHATIAVAMRTTSKAVNGLLARARKALAQTLTKSPISLAGRWANHE
jgi:RNA polymerase sigma factor (sigma-70 family)